MYIYLEAMKEWNQTPSEFLALPEFDRLYILAYTILTGEMRAVEQYDIEATAKRGNR